MKRTGSGKKIPVQDFVSPHKLRQGKDDSGVFRRLVDTYAIALECKNSVSRAAVMFMRWAAITYCGNGKGPPPL